MKRSLDWRAMRKVRMRQIKARGKGVWSRMAAGGGIGVGTGYKSGGGNFGWSRQRSFSRGYFEEWRKADSFAFQSPLEGASGG